MKINPTTDTNSSGLITESRKSAYLTPGKKLLAPIGVVYRDIETRKGLKRIMELYYCCIQDYEKNDEEGAIHKETFWLTEAAKWKVGNFANSMRVNYEFNCEDRSDMEKIFANSVAHVAIVKSEEKNGYTNTFIVAFGRPDKSLIKEGRFQTTNEQHEIIVNCEKAFTKIIQKRRENGVVFIEPFERIEDDNNSEEEIPF